MKIKQVKGFTLIELMVVIVIIAVLASFALPAYGRYMEKGKLAQARAEVNKVVTEAKNSAMQDPAFYKNLTLDELNTLVDAKIPSESKSKYEFTSSLITQNTKTTGFRITITPKSDSGFTKAAWADSHGAGYICDTAAAANAFQTSSGCSSR